MRIDKYLWAVRIFKTRNQASEACKKNKISIDSNNLKASKEIKPGDQIEIRKNQINYKIKVLDLPKSRVGAKLVELYCVDITSPEELNKLEMMKLSKVMQRDRGSGRPTKRDRRDLDDYFESDEDFNWDSLFENS